MISTKRLSLVLVGAAALAGLACSEGPTGPVAEPNVLTLPALILSDAGRASASGQPAGSDAVAASAAEVTYVSLPPGTLLEMASVRIRNLTTGRAAPAIAVVEGGFDPVPVGATAGDELELSFIAGSGSTSVAYAVVPDRRAPVVVRTNPPRGRTDVALSVRPRVIFSEPVDPATLADGVRLMRDGAEVEASVGLLPDEAWTAELVPAVALEPETTYELRITQEVRDLDGDALEEPLSVPFTTESVPADPNAVWVWGILWTGFEGVEDRWAYHWSGGPARRLTVSRISEPTAVVWEVVAVSGAGFGSSTGGSAFHGWVPTGVRATVEAVEPVTPTRHSVWYRVSVTLVDGREGSWEFNTYRPSCWWEDGLESCDPGDMAPP